ncbi:MAG: hypothetical protein LRZ88_06630 [Candidatus Cloacimonetes bacterium]|nr:hypothetical protein [Candidatus Cloacimonadota bacterium]
MKKTLILLFVLVSLFGILLAQQTPMQIQTGRDNSVVVVDEEEIVIDVRSLAPESGIYKAKSETYSTSGKYRFVLDDQIVRENSEILLNKWLKESK